MENQYFSSKQLKEIDRHMIKRGYEILSLPEEVNGQKVIDTIYYHPIYIKEDTINS